MTIQQAQEAKAEKCLRHMRYALDVAQRWECRSVKVSQNVANGGHLLARNGYRI